MTKVALAAAAVIASVAVCWLPPNVKPVFAPLWAHPGAAYADRNAR